MVSRDWYVIRRVIALHLLPWGNWSNFPGTIWCLYIGLTLSGQYDLIRYYAQSGTCGTRCIHQDIHTRRLHVNNRDIVYTAVLRMSCSYIYPNKCYLQHQCVCIFVSVRCFCLFHLHVYLKVAYESWTCQAALLAVIFNINVHVLSGWCDPVPDEGKLVCGIVTVDSVPYPGDFPSRVADLLLWLTLSRYP